jgi:hypothetical protein
MSENYTWYVTKMAELRVRRSAVKPLSGQLQELLGFVMMCEAHWEAGAKTEGSPDTTDGQ